MRSPCKVVVCLALSISGAGGFGLGLAPSRSSNVVNVVQQGSSSMLSGSTGIRSYSSCCHGELGMGTSMSDGE